MDMEVEFDILGEDVVYIVTVTHFEAPNRHDDQPNGEIMLSQEVVRDDGVPTCWAAFVWHWQAVHRFQTFNDAERNIDERAYDVMYQRYCDSFDDRM